jgi:hypothetical protein
MQNMLEFAAVLTRMQGQQCRLTEAAGTARMLPPAADLLFLLTC